MDDLFISAKINYVFFPEETSFCRFSLPLTNGYNLLELTITDILRVINPSKEDWSFRFQMINEIRAMVGSIENLRGATV